MTANPVIASEHLRGNGETVRSGIAFRLLQATAEDNIFSDYSAHSAHIRCVIVDALYKFKLTLTPTYALCISVTLAERRCRVDMYGRRGAQARPISDVALIEFRRPKNFGSTKLDQRYI